MSEWKETKVINLCRRVVSGGTPLRSNPGFYEDGNIPWLKTGEVKQGYIYDTSEKITELGLAGSSAKLVPKNSVIVAMYGDGDTAGSVGINKIDLTTNQACCNLIIDEEIAHYRFIYFYLKGSYNNLVNLKLGGSQQNLNAHTIKNFDILLPPLETQRKITAILSTYDDLIENNNKRIALLEKAAEEIYREWFVRLCFPGWESAVFRKGVPEGWEVKELQDVDILIIDGDRGKHYPGKNEFSESGYCLFLNTGNIKNDKFDYSTCDFITEQKDSLLRKGRLRPNDIVLTTRGTVGRIAYHSENALFTNVRINSGMVIIRSNSSMDDSLYWYNVMKSPLMQEQYRLFSSGAAQPQLPIKDLKRIKALIPDEFVLKQFCELISNINTQMEKLQAVNWKLTSSRDLLLSRLISGKLPVDDLDIHVPPSMMPAQEPANA